MLKETELTESADFTDIEESVGLVGSKYVACLIKGDVLGSTGFYPAETLLRDGPKIFKKGTPMYLNHMTAEEAAVRPHGSVQDYVGELAEDAYYDGDGLYAKIDIFEHQRPLIKSLKDKIGISIRARGRVTQEIMEGKTVPVFKELVLARSADFVVKAGAGGKIVSIEESAKEAESASDTKEGKESMEEVLEELRAFRADVSTRLVALEEAAKPAVEEEVVVEESATLDALEIAEALSASSLSAEGRKRVLQLHRADKGSELSKLIEAEEAYIKSAVVEAEESAGHVEDEVVEAEESATIKLPTAWKSKETK